MSHKYYDNEFRSVCDYLSQTLNAEPSPGDRREHRQLLSTLYVRYILIANKLATCEDQTVQPQKRVLIRHLLEAALGRVLELKSELVEADLNEWTHYGDVLENLQVTPQEVELTVPNCLKNEQQDLVLYKRKIIKNVLDKLGFVDKAEEKRPMTEQKAILVIQTHERARQGRLRAQFMKEVRSMKDKSKPTALGGEAEDKDQSGSTINWSSAIKIQTIWRGYLARRATRRRKLQEMLLIGMIPPPKKRNHHLEIDQENQERRRRVQEEYFEKYCKEVELVRENLEKTQREQVLEQLSDQVRGWLHEYKAQTGKIPEYTGSERSASRVLLSRQGTDSDTTSKSTPGSSKESKSKKVKEQKPTEPEEEIEGTAKTAVSVFVPELNRRKEEYEERWKNKDESGNPQQYHYKDIIAHEQMTKMENELRKTVDEMMKAELMLLQEAFDKDRGYKSKKKISKKSRKASKKGKKKKEKDLTPDRTRESLFEELVANGIIKLCADVKLTNFLGERSFFPAAPHNKGKEPPVDLGDLRQILKEYCVIPLLSPQLHLSTPHTKSLLLAGPKGSGKHMLVNAICQETGATLFDLTPANIVGKYPGKSGLIMLIHLVVKVSKLLQPSVIYMGNAERPFVKKIPKTDKSDPKRLKKDLPKIIKNFTVEDRVMFIGVSNCPWEGDQKLLQQVYQKFLVVPKPKYSSRYFIWSELLNQYAPISANFDTSVISKISDGYTVGSIVSTIKEVITVKRMLQLKIRPLSPLELVNALCKRNPVYKEEEEALEAWWSKVPIVRRRLRAVELLKEEEAEQMAKQASAKKK